MKKAIVLMLAVLLCLGALMSGASAMAPSILYASYWHEDNLPMVNLAYFDEENRDWIELYLLKSGVVEPNMGLMEISDLTYSVVGIQTVDPGYPNGVNVLLKSGVRVIETDLYLGDCALPAEGERLYLTVGLTDSAYYETLGELIPFTVQPMGQITTLGTPLSFSADDPLVDEHTIITLEALSARGDLEMNPLDNLARIFRKLLWRLPKVEP